MRFLGTALVNASMPPAPPPGWTVQRIGQLVIYTRVTASGQRLEVSDCQSHALWRVYQPGAGHPSARGRCTLDEAFANCERVAGGRA